MSSHQVRRVLVQLQGERFRRGLKVANRMRRVQLQVQAKGRRRLCRIRVWPQRYGEIGFEIFYRNRLVILDFEPLGSESRYGRDARAEDRTAFRLLRAALTHLQQSRIDRL